MPATRPLETEPVPESRRRQRRAVFAAWFAFYVDLFDIYLPIVVLAPAIDFFMPGSMDAKRTAIAGSAIFAAALLGRPLGALIFGRFADRLGRKRATVVAVTGAGATNLVIALLPGYQQLGVVSVAALVLSRFVAGVFLGGEYTAANPLAMECSPKHRRGLYSGLINTGFPLAYASIALLTMLILSIMPSSGVGSAYVQWGWRIPFLIGSLLALGLARYYHVAVEESTVFRSSGGTKTPIRSLFSPENRASFWQIFLVMSGFWLALQPVAAVLPGVLGTRVIGLQARTVSLILVLAYLILAGANVGAAVLSQRVGRRRFLMAAGVLTAVTAGPMYFALVRFSPSNPTLVAALVIGIVVLTFAPWGLLPAYLTESFRTGVRASGYGLGYSLAVVLPSFYGVYQTGLATAMPFEYTGIVLLAAGSLLITAGAACGPETKDVDFTTARPAANPRSRLSAAQGNEGDGAANDERCTGSCLLHC